MNPVIQDIAVDKILNEGIAPVINELSGAVQDLLYKVPTPPETAGTYVLQAVVAADLSVTYSWVAAN